MGIEENSHWNTKQRLKTSYSDNYLSGSLENQALFSNLVLQEAL